MNLDAENFAPLADTLPATVEFITLQHSLARTLAQSQEGDGGVGACIQ